MLNRTLAIASIAVLALTALLYLTKPSGGNLFHATRVDTKLPKGSFSLAETRDGFFSEPSIALRFAPPTVQLPDLKRELVFCSVNERPDADQAHPTVHLSLQGNKEVAAIRCGEARFVRFDQNSYTFSRGNEETNLWITPVKVTNGNLELRVGMTNEQGELVQTPQERAELSFTARQGTRSGSRTWHLGDLRVDNSLLARQRARWYGQDCFLEDHGGKEFSFALGKERIDFGDADSIYSCFAAEGALLIWKGERWHAPQADEKTERFPLMHIKRCDEKLIYFDVWDVEGRSKVSLSLMRSPVGWNGSSIASQLRFVAAKTWSQFVVECGQQRLEVAPGDWLLIKEGEWTKLESLDDVDAFVARRLAGDLLVIDGLAKRGGRRVLSCHLYNPTRTESLPIEVPLTTTTGAMAPLKTDETKPLIAIPSVIRELVEELSD